MANIETGVKIIRAFTDVLNDICKNEGGIQRDDTRIWDWLHNLSEQEWDDLITTLEAVHSTSPGSFTASDEQILQQTRNSLNKALTRGKSFVGKPMIASSGNKYAAWRITMTMREVINRYNGVDIKNGTPRPPPPSAFDDIFTTE